MECYVGALVADCSARRGPACRRVDDSALPPLAAPLPVRSGTAGIQCSSCCRKIKPQHSWPCSSHRRILSAEIGY